MGFTPKGLAVDAAKGFNSHTLRFPYYNNRIPCSRIDFKACLIQSDNVRPFFFAARSNDALSSGCNLRVVILPLTRSFGRVGRPTFFLGFFSAIIIVLQKSLDSLLFM